MRLFLLILLVAFSITTAATEVYRWTDESGQVHFSDMPHEGAETVTLPEAQTFSIPAPRQAQGAAEDEQAGKEEEDSYSAVRIVNPRPGEVLWSTSGLLEVAVSTQPRLRRGHTLHIFLDGQRMASLTGTERKTELNGVYRGEHTLRVDVRDARDRVVADGNSVAFTVKQTSIQNQNNPNVARPTPR